MRERERERETEKESKKESKELSERKTMQRQTSVGKGWARGG